MPFNARQYEIGEPFFGAADGNIVALMDQKRNQAYNLYEDLYWNNHASLKIVLRGKDSSYRYICLVERKLSRQQTVFSVRDSITLLSLVLRITRKNRPMKAPVKSSNSISRIGLSEKNYGPSLLVINDGDSLEGTPYST